MRLLNGSISASKVRIFVLAVAAAVFVPLAACDSRTSGEVEVRYTVGDLVSVHDEVTLDGKPVQGSVRLSEGQKVATGKTGRASLRLDSGAMLALDGSSAMQLLDGRLRLAQGRIFARVDEQPLNVTFGKATAKLVSSAVAFDLTSSEQRTYCASGELTIQGPKGQSRVEAGETASFQGENLRVLPEKAFDDWTGGLAAPTQESRPQKTAIPYARAVVGSQDAGTPLVIRSHQVDTKIVGEVSVTKSSTTYFNGSDKNGEVHVRLALPEGAMVTDVALQLGKEGPLQKAGVHVSAGPSRTFGTSVHGLEWAGNGWLQGTLATLSAGETLRLELTYAEWLPLRDGHATYRYRAQTEADQSTVSELGIRVDAEETKTGEISANLGALVKGRQVTYRTADVRPRGDFVVELTPDVVKNGRARIYVERTGLQKKDAYILVRTELPEKRRTGVTLAVVVDTSLSIGASTLETSLAVVDALVKNLSESDSIVIVAADENARTVGPALPAPVTAALRKQLVKELSLLRVGGASNLSRGLEKAADLIDSTARGKDAGQGMVIYVGDGNPTMGERDANSLRKALAARPGGIPRLGAAALGPSPNRGLLAGLLRNTGTLVEVLDRADAAHAGALLLGDAVEPRYREVELDLGPHVDRVYPRRSQVVAAGSTVSVIGRLRGPVPTKIGISYRDGAEVVSQERAADRLRVPPGGHLDKQWALARVQEIASLGEGIEPAIALAAEAGLLTPWTGFLFSGLPEEAGTLPFAHRIFELSPLVDSPFMSQIAPPMTEGSSLIEPGSGEGPQVNLVQAAAFSMRRLLEQSARSIRACRDARASVNPQVGDTFRISVTVDQNGATTSILIREQDVSRRDLILERCMEGVVKSLPYVSVGTSVSVDHELTLTGRRSVRPTKCSEASKTSLPVRREIWRQRGPKTAEHYREASESCELRRWPDRQEFLSLMMQNRGNGRARLGLARELTLAGEEDAAQFVVQQTLRAIQTFSELQELILILREHEPNIDAELAQALEATSSSEEGLEVCRKFLRLAPHSTYARQRLLALLLDLKQKEQVIGLVRDFRTETVADAGLLADGASALLRLGLAEEGRRAFGELIERAPRDPWTYALVGDRLRGEGLFDEASAAYESLARMLPEEAAVTLRQALAHAGAGRIDVASRLLDRVSQTGGRQDEGRLADLAAITEATLLVGARGGKDAEVQAEIERRLLRTPLPDASALVLVEAAPSSQPVRLSLFREEGETLAQTAEMDASRLGLLAARIERGETGTVRLALERDKIAGPSHPILATVSVLSLGAPGTLPRLSKKQVSVSADGKPLTLALLGGNLK